MPGKQLQYMGLLAQCSYYAQTGLSVHFASAYNIGSVRKLFFSTIKSNSTRKTKMSHIAQKSCYRPALSIQKENLHHRQQQMMNSLHCPQRVAAHMTVASNKWTKITQKAHRVAWIFTIDDLKPCLPTFCLRQSLSHSR